MFARLVAINCRYSHSNPALFYLRECLRTHFSGLETEIIQLTINDPYYRVLLRLLDRGPDVVFFSVYLWNSRLTLALARDISRALPSCRIVLGGPEAAEITRLMPGVTMVEGEIEGVDPAFYHDLESGRLRSLYRCRRAGAFPSPYNDEDFRGLLADRAIYYESSRGCPFSCAYCLSSIDRGVRHKPVEAVMAEIRAIFPHHPKIIRFIDRTFNSDPARALDLWRQLAGLDTDTVFHFEVAPDLFTPEQLEFLATVPVGRFQFEAGVQSVNEKTLAAVNRKMDVEAALANLTRLALIKKIHIHADLILGLPFEDGDSFRDSFNQVWRSGAHHLQVGLLKVLPRTRMRERAGEFGLLFREDPPYEVIATRWLPQPDLARLHLIGETCERFGNNRFFVSLWDYLRQRGEDGFGLFSLLFDFAGGMAFLNQSPTQKRLGAILYEFAAGREDRQLFRDLLLYDWLCYGNQYLPEGFAPLDLYGERRRAGRLLPQVMAGLYDHRTRDCFLRETLFFQPSQALLRQLDYPENTRMLALLAAEDDDVPRRRRVVAV